MGYKEIFADNFDDLLKQENLNCNKLAPLIEIKGGDLSAYIRGLYLPLVNNLIKISDYFNVSVDYMLGLTDNRQFTKSKNNEKFIDRLLLLLKKEPKTSFYKLALSIGVDDGIFSKWKKGSVPVTETIIKIALYFGVSVDYLIGRSDN